MTGNPVTYTRNHNPVPDKPGAFQMIDKGKLNIDHRYQRAVLVQSRIGNIAANFTWRKFGVLQVSRRPDGTFWVFDGQHRKIGADRRDDITMLPCMVFEDSDVTGEATAFLDVNSNRGAVKAVSRYKAQLLAGDPVALKVQKALNDTGYRVNESASSRATSQNFTANCIGALVKTFSIDPQAAEVAWKLCAEIYLGRPPADRVLVGIWGTQRHLVKHYGVGLEKGDYRQALLRLGGDEIKNSILATQGYEGKSSDKIYAEGVVRLLNRGRRNRIPSPYANGEDGDE